LIIPRVFSLLPVWLLLLLSVTPIALQYFRIGPLSQSGAIGITVGAAVAVVVLYVLGKNQGQAPAATIANALARARQIHAACIEKSEATYHRENARIQNEFTANTEHIDENLKVAL